jgi:CRP-like cAMP-binding protein
VRADPETLALIERVFACSAETAQTIALPARRRAYDPRAILVTAGARQTEILLILYGRARLVCLSVDGNLVPLDELTAGDLFGSLSSDDREAMDLELSALTRLEAAIFGALDFVGLAERHGCVGLALSRMLLRRIRRTTEKVVERSTLSAMGRVYAELRKLADAAPDGRTISPPPVLARIAATALTTRETASRAVAAIERRGIVSRSDLALTIVSLRQLEELIV